MILFYSEECDGKTAKLLGAEAIHCRQSLRKSIGDQVHVTDGKGRAYTGEITDINKKSVDIKIHEPLHLHKERDFKLHIGIAPTKNISRFEWFLEKATEFGIDEITPLLCERSERKVIKEERLNKILLSAMKQSLKTELPQLHPLTKLKDFLEQGFKGQCFIAHLEEDPELLIASVEKGGQIFVLIGPEGDFSPAEIEMASRNGFKPVSLGDYRLRTETAGIAAVQQVHFVHQIERLSRG